MPIKYLRKEIFKGMLNKTDPATTITIGMAVLIIEDEKIVENKNARDAMAIEAINICTKP